VIEQAAVLTAADEIDADDLQLGRSDGPVAGAPPASDLPFTEAKRRTVEDFERAYLLSALREHDGNVSRTANAIGMVRQSLQQKIRELDLRNEDWSRDGE